MGRNLLSVIVVLVAIGAGSALLLWPRGRPSAVGPTAAVTDGDPRPAPAVADRLVRDGVGPSARAGAAVRVVHAALPVAGAEVVMSPAPTDRPLFERVQGGFVRSNRGPTVHWTSVPMAEGIVLGLTDADGRLALPRLPERVAILARSGPLRSPALVMLEQPAEAAEWTLALSAERSLGIEVVDAETQQPVPAACAVFVELRGPEPSSAARYLRCSDDRPAPFVAGGFLDGDRLTVVARHAGYAVGEATLTVGEDVESCRIELQMVRNIAGRVVDTDGTPVAGAMVRGHDVDFRFRRDSCISDSDGRFRLSTEKGRFRIDATHPGFSTATVDEVAAGTQDVELVVRRVVGARVDGRVLRAGGSPVVGARVELWRSGRTGMDAQRDLLRIGDAFLAVVTADGGRFAFETVPPGAYELDVVPPVGPASAEADEHIVTGRHAAVAELDVAEGSWPGFQEISLAERGRIAVTFAATAVAELLESEPSTTIPHAHLSRVRVEERDLLPLANAELIGERTILFTELAPGDYVVKTTPRSAVAHVELRGTETQRVERGALPAPVEGRVARGGLPLPSCRIVAAGVDRPASVAQARSDGDGRFVLRGIEAGDHLVQLRDRQGLVALQRVTFSTARPAQLDWPSGRALCAFGGRVPAGAELRVEAEEIAGIELATRLAAALRTVAVRRIGAEPRETIEGLGAGRYRFALVADDGSTLREQTAVVLEGAVVEVRL